MKSISGQWADFIAGLSIDSVPASVWERAKVRLLDSLGTGLAAAGLKVPGLALALVEGSSGPCSVLRNPRRMAPADAALVNATMVNGRSQDDFVQKSHAGAVTIPSVLAMAEHAGRAGTEVLAGIVAGYEITGRVYMGGPRMLPRFRATGVAGTVGAAAAAARVLGLEPTMIMNALGTAACFSHGFGQGFLSGTTEVKLNVGMAARSGVSAALLAKHGATASALAFEGDAGFYRGFSNGVEDIGECTRDLGKRFLIEETVYKECPVCIFTQTPIALARAIASEIDPAEIERVTVTAPELTYTNPGFTNVAPYRTHLQAVVSARFCTAAALLGKPVESHDFYDQTEDEDVLRLAEKIDLKLRAEDAGRVDLEVVHRKGTRTVAAVEQEMLFPTKEKVIAKFRRLTKELPVDSDAIVKAVMGVDGMSDIRNLTGLLAG